MLIFVNSHCNRPSANATSSVSSLASPLIQTSLGAVNVGGALPSFSTASIASTKAPTTTQAASSLVVSSTGEPSSSISSTVTHSTSHIFAPVSSSRFATSLRSATSPSPSPTPKESSTTEKAETTPAAAPSSSPKPVTTAAPETTKAATAPQVTTAAPASSGSDSATSSSDISAYLSAHNTIRAQHGASDLTWSDELASKAQQWANGCVFQHSGGSLGPFGENLAAGTGSSYDIAAAVKSWTDEVSEYNANSPVPSHFTQVVWKASTQVGCAVQSCNGIFAASFGLAKFFVCEYSPQGNVIGEFA
ncbi:hypothetical protein PHLGIDRAFT_62838 [Phlebiopsis gigantea 11061_1 CR5-6]|uniref:SCP domain-containing protein n=1 Tax=Phlebiopsis gigantea (strain 11061_1 CR5-6) TaxID=745531 RepID=A0A0C3S6S5_PHLG1|nr:hypothetical protein PHLGIDRAFT_62838 [Phlebiopsis gigantea 11061_1 CR5-6]